MKLSEAISLGSTLNPQAFGKVVDASCGAVVLGVPLLRRWDLRLQIRNGVGQPVSSSARIVTRYENNARAGRQRIQCRLSVPAACYGTQENSSPDGDVSSVDSIVAIHSAI